MKRHYCKRKEDSRVLRERCRDPSRLWPEGGTKIDSTIVFSNGELKLWCVVEPLGPLVFSKTTNTWCVLGGIISTFLLAGFFMKKR